MLDFWDFTCINCLRGLPYLREWHARYADVGLTIVGVHTPEFAFARDVAIVKSAAGRLGIRYPVVLDNEQALWTAYATSCWPTRHLIDTQGYVRGVKQGEGGYAALEAAIQALLREKDPQVVLPELMAPIRPEDATGAVCLPTTPELQRDALAAALTEREAADLVLPSERPEGRIYASGTWRGITDGIRLDVSGGSIVLPYHAGSVNAVLAPAIDPPLTVEILQDGVALPVERFGDDVRLDDGKARLLIDTSRLYALVRNPETEPHELRLEVPRPGLVFYAFSFGTCALPEAQLASDPTE